MADVPEVPQEPQGTPDEADLHAFDGQNQIGADEALAVFDPSVQNDGPLQELEFSRTASAPNRLKPALRAAAAGLGLLALSPVLQVTYTYDTWKSFRAAHRRKPTDHQA